MCIEIKGKEYCCSFYIQLILIIEPVIAIHWWTTLESFQKSFEQVRGK